MMNKKLTILAVGSVLGLLASSTFAALPPKAQLQMDSAGLRLLGCIAGGVINPDTGVCRLTPTSEDSPLLNVSSKGSFFNLGDDASIHQLGNDPAVGGVFDPLAGGVRLNEIMTPSGNHSGAPQTGPVVEVPVLDAPWAFSSSTGMHGIGPERKIVIDAGDDGTGDGEATLDFGGWYVIWGTVTVNIPMGGCALGDIADNAGFSGCDADKNGTDELVNTGLASLKCYKTTALLDADVTEAAEDPDPGTTSPDGDCSEGDFYALDYFANVPAGNPSNFGGAGYTLHLEGVIADPNQAPVATNDPLVVNMLADATVSIDLAANVTDPDGDAIDTSTCIITYSGSRNPTIGSNANSCDVSYSDIAGTAVVNDPFTYTVADEFGKVAGPFTVNVSVSLGNIFPTAGNTTVLTNKDTPVTVDVVALSGDLDGELVPTTVAVVVNETVGGSTSVDPVTGEVIFTPTEGVTGEGSFKYTINDDSGDTSNQGLVTVNVNDPPVATDTSISVFRNSSGGILVSSFATDSDGTLDITSVSATDPANGVVSVDTVTGVITYTPSTSYIGADSFTFTIDDDAGAKSNVGTVSVSVDNNPPSVSSDRASVNIAAESSVTVDALLNDVDIDGNIEASTVIITTQPLNGAVTVDSAGIMTYTADGSGFVGTDSFFYTVKDNDDSTSNIGQVDISVSNADITVLNPLAFLLINTGNVPEGTEVEPAPGEGSWFSMQLSPEPAAPSYISVSGFNHLRLGIIQPANSKPPAQSGIDQPWPFTGPVGVHQTTAPITVRSDDASGNITLDFSGWDVSWNGIPSIPLNAGLSNGTAIMTCAIDDCRAGDTYTLDYFATVPEGDPSGFGLVRYHLHLEGTVSDPVEPTIGGGDPDAPVDITDISVKDAIGAAVTVTPGSAASAAGNTTGTRLTSGQVGIDPLINTQDGRQCIGGCLDFVVSGLTEPYIDLVFYLSDPLLSGSFYRKSINGNWDIFNTSQGDLLGSAKAVSGLCQQPEGVFSIGLREGNQCVYLRIFDGGPNDADGVVNGVIVDPSGAATAGSPNVPASGSNSGGCSISSSSVAITERSDWLLVVAFLAIVALRRRKNIKG